MTNSHLSDITYMDYWAWKMEILKISRYRTSVKAERVQALMEKGKQLKRKGKIRNYDEWAHLMWVLRNKYVELTSET